MSLPKNDMHRANTRTHIAELDGLRGIAILLVLGCHLSNAIAHASHRMTLALFLGRLGWCGVDLFFVLSGFLITSILVNEEKTRGYFTGFYLKRVLRILPLYFAFLLIFFFTLGRAVPVGDRLWFWFFGSNWRDAMMPEVQYLGHLWSLSVEEQFYLVWPLAIFLVPRRRAWMLCLGCCAVAFGFSLSSEWSGATHATLLRLTPFRMGALAIGGLLAVVSKERLKTLLLWLAPASFLAAAWLLILAFGSFDRNPPYATLTYVVTSVMFAAAVAQCVIWTGTKTAFATLMRNPALRAFGKFSYAIYVLHPLFIAGTLFDRLWAVLDKRFEFVTAASLAILIVVGASYCAAMCSWYLLESHFLRLKGRIGKLPQFKWRAPAAADGAIIAPWRRANTLG